MDDFKLVKDVHDDGIAVITALAYSNNINNSSNQNGKALRILFLLWIKNKAHLNVLNAKWIQK